VLLNNLRNLGFLNLMGHSLGGSVMILVSHILSSHSVNPFQENYKGTILLSPFLGDNFQINPIICCLINTLARYYPNGQIPSWLMDETKCNKYIWNDPKYLEYRNKSCYNQNMQVGTLSSILEIDNIIHSKGNTSSGYNFPMCVIYDKEDDIIITPEQINKIANYNILKMVVMIS